MNKDKESPGLQSGPDHDFFNNTQYFYKKDFVPVKGDASLLSSICKTPRDIYNYLDDNVYGHQEYKKVLSVFLWKCFTKHRPKGALLVAGQSGTGKTEMIRTLGKVYTNFTVIDGSQISPQSYKGNTKLYSGLQNLDFTPEAQMPILVIDEFDKMVIKHQNGWSDTSLIPELYKLLEGGNINIGTEEKPRIVDTRNVAFVLLGAFSNIEKPRMPIGFGCDLEKSKLCGLNKKAIFDMIPPELQGRIEQTVILDIFDESDYINILTDKRYSPIHRIEDEFNIRLEVSDEKIKQISHDAYINQTGVRSLNNQINEYVNGKLFVNPEVKTITME